MWCHIPAVPVLGRLNWDDLRFEASLDYLVRHLKKKKVKIVFLCLLLMGQGSVIDTFLTLLSLVKVPEDKNPLLTFTVRKCHSKQAQQQEQLRAHT